MADRELALVTLSDGRRVDVDDTGADDPQASVVFWHRGSPHTGRLYEPLPTLARDEGVRIVAVSRPAYGRATTVPERSVAQGARDALEVADLLGIERFAAVGESGGGPHALASAALAPDRVAAVAVFASPAPFVDAAVWWDGMASDAALRSATRGREARIRFADTDDFDPSIFVDTDWAALEGEWAGLGDDAGAAGDAGGTGLVDDDIALVRPWGVELADVRAPVLLVQGRRDRVIPPAHAELLAAALPDARIWWRDEAGHVAVLGAARDAIGWLLQA